MITIGQYKVTIQSSSK